MANATTSNADFLFQNWAEEKQKDTIRFCDRRTFVDRDAAPAEMLTPASHKEDQEGGFTTIEPVTVLRKANLETVAEIVRISYWIAIKQDGTTFYQVNLVCPHRPPFGKDQLRTVSVDVGRWPTESEFEQLSDLLTDVRRYLTIQQEIDAAAKRLI